MVSMKDVAVECGVSIATVSKALNDHSDISEETRRKVKEAANRLGYYPNSAARALKTESSVSSGLRRKTPMPAIGILFPLLSVKYSIFLYLLLLALSE